MFLIKSIFIGFGGVFKGKKISTIEIKKLRNYEID